MRKLFFTTVAVLVFIVLCNSALAFRTCICQQGKGQGGRCCDFISKTRVLPNQNEPAGCTCRPCRPSYVCDHVGRYLCRAVDIHTRLREKTEGFCVRESFNKTIWVPYEHLNFAVPPTARITVIAKNVVYLAYKGTILTRCVGDVACTTPPIQFGQDACEHPLLIASYGNGSPLSAKFALSTSAGQLYSSGCDRWPLPMFRAKVYPRLAPNWQNISFADSQQFPPLQLATETAHSWQGFLQSTHAKPVACGESTAGDKAIVAVSALPFCVGSTVV